MLSINQAGQTEYLDLLSSANAEPESTHFLAQEQLMKDEPDLRV